MNPLDGPEPTTNDVRAALGLPRIDLTTRHTNRYTTDDTDQAQQRWETFVRDTQRTPGAHRALTRTAIARRKIANWLHTIAGKLCDTTDYDQQAEDYYGR